MDKKDSPTEYQPKYHLKRFDVVLRKFTDVAIPLHLQLLNKHKENIHNFQEAREWDKVHREQVNASRTIQQLKADVWEVDRVRQQLVDEDADRFEKRVAPIRKEALDAVQEFIEYHRNVTNPTQSMFQSPSEADEEDENEDRGVLRFDRPVLVDLKSPNTTVEESWKNLREDLVSLNQMIHDFDTAVSQQQETVDRIEDNLEDARENVAEGTKELCTASKYKLLLYPAAVAAMGFTAAASLGLIVGLKLGALAAVSGGLLGYTGGKRLKQRNDEAVEVEMVELSHKNLKGSLSLPELNNLPNDNAQ